MSLPELPITPVDSSAFQHSMCCSLSLMLQFATLRIRSTGVLAVGLAVLLAGTGRAQMSPFFITGGNVGKIFVVQGGSVVSTIPTVTAPTSGAYEYPIAVYASAFRTANSAPGSGNGYEYTLSGTPTGPTYSLPSPIGSAWDSTTDGVHNYLLDFAGGAVYQTGLDFSSPVALFGGLGGSAYLGIAYDPTNNSLWVSGWSTNQVIDFSMSGTQLSSFAAAPASGLLTSLALEPATGTLWMGTQNTGIFYQFSKTGVLLQTVTVPALLSIDILGGEFAFTAIPESSPLVLLSLGLLTLAGIRRWRRT